ncbi:MAG: YeiH family putative sulfate export transporter [Rhodomicrobium sp.]|nr:YeiH family putative sulfate export transporter [Rhodomicrobium sp.]
MAAAIAAVAAGPVHEPKQVRVYRLRSVARLSQIGGIWPGLLLACTITVAAFALRQIPGLAAFSPLILAILLGMLFHNIVGTPGRAKAGVLFSMRKLLRLGIVLLGLQLTLTQVAAVGASGVAIIVVTLIATFIFTKWFGRVIGVDRKLSELIAAGTSICGASAVITANTVTDAHDEDVAYAVACVTVFGSIAMFVYPMLPQLLSLNEHSFGLWAGSSIHEIAQVVAAAFQDGKEAGKFGTIAKLSRVMMLAPVVLALSYLATRGGGREEGANAAPKPPVPWFVFGFIALVVLNSIVTVPAVIKDNMPLVTLTLLSIALGAMGLETDMRKMAAKGLRPLLLGAASTLFIALFSLGLIVLLAPVG